MNEIDYDIVKMELKKLSKKEIIEISIFFPTALNNFARRREWKIRSAAVILGLKDINKVNKENKVNKVNKEYISKDGFLILLKEEGIRNVRQYLKFRKESKRIDLPFHPKLFKMTWVEVFGKKILKKEEAMKIVHSMKFNSASKYKKWKKESNINFLPLDPVAVYKIAWNEYLGTRLRKFLPKNKAIKVIRELKFKSSTEYLNWKKINNRVDLPADIFKHYGLHWNEFLGTKGHYRCKQPPSKKELISILRLNRVSTLKEYRIFRKRVKNIPYSPTKYYKTTWRELSGK